MAKNTMGTKLPRKLEQKMALMGEQIKLARLRRNLSIAQVAERVTCSPLTVNRIEKGSPTVSIGIYARVLYATRFRTAFTGVSQRANPRNTQHCSILRKKSCNLPKNVHNRNARPYS